MALQLPPLLRLPRLLDDVDDVLHWMGMTCRSAHTCTALRTALDGALCTADIQVLEELSAAQHIILRDGFLPAPDAAALRGVFDQRFADPRAMHPERMLWDWWHVPDQYTLIRTQVGAGAGAGAGGWGVGPPGATRSCACGGTTELRRTQHSGHHTHRQRCGALPHNPPPTPSPPPAAPASRDGQPPQAQVYFPEPLYARLEDALLAYGESQLGCRGMTPIWMSYYVDGCVQE